MIITTRIEQSRLKRPQFDLHRGLAVASPFPGHRPMVSSSEAEPEVRAYAPLTEGEIVPWMQMATVANLLLWGQQADYQNAGGQINSVSGDPFIPGCRVADIYIFSMRGSDAQGQGMVVATPYGNFVVPYQQARVIAVKDLLAWGVHLYGWYLQFYAALMQWTKLASTPMTQRIRFSNIYNFTVPNFIKFQTRVPSPVAAYFIGVSSPSAQSLSLKARSLSDYSNILFEQTMDVGAGESENTLVVTGFPFADAFAAELISSSTEMILDYVKVFP